MCALLSSEPLAVVHALGKDGSVKTYLHERIFPRKQVSTQVLDALSTLELHLAKQQARAQALAQQQQQQTAHQAFGRPPAGSAAAAAQRPPLHHDAERLLSGGLDMIISSLCDQGSAVTYITERNLAPLFPLSARALRIPFHEDKAAGDLDSHLRHMTVLNELVGMAVQLQNDIKLTNHKYMAHQLALLYQCLTQAGGSFLKYKSRVEERFDEVKGVTTSAKDEPQLSDVQKDWLTQLTTDIVSEAVFSGIPDVFAAGSPGLAKYLEVP